MLMVAAMALYGCSISQFVVTPMILRRAALYFGKEAEFWPAEFSADHELFANVTVAPQWPGAAESYFVDSRALVFPDLQSPFFHKTLSTFLMICFWSLAFLDSPRKIRQAASAAIALALSLGLALFWAGLSDRSEAIWGDDGDMESEEAASLVGLALILFLAGSVTVGAIVIVASGMRSKCKFVCKFLGLWVLYVVMERLLYEKCISEPFYSGTSIVDKMIIRSVGHALYTYIMIEMHWQFTKTAVRDHGLPASVGVALIGAEIGKLCFKGRMMTGSASSIGEAVLFEICGLVTELSLANKLLRGRTPFLGWRLTFRNCCCAARGTGKHKTNAVQPDQAMEVDNDLRNGDDSEGMGGEDDVVESTRRRFCADLLWLTCIGEAYALAVVGMYTYKASANPAAQPGTPAIAKEVVFANVMVQLLGELVLSDALVAFVASRFPKKYCIDVVAENATSSTYYRTLAVLAMTLIPGYYLAFFNSYLCFTSSTERAADDWVLTSCPAPPDLGDMQTVGTKWMEGGEIYE
ncbi:hypothetical protein TeGR_g14962 [Tetraparma gracilis]|uniref:Uncharacterized protein n=1 Tax=Tetraparma gracilis TaxID=2962635 RepID=A0ABQ6MMC0_9STRA|nr:hypothetical protein TeGR_g14962 [Tetraparma gracilis]